MKNGPIFGVGRFCGPRLKYLSSPTGREGEICRPLDHMRHFPFIISARLIESANFYTYRTVFWIFSPCGTLRCVLMHNCLHRPLVELLVFFIRGHISAIIINIIDFQFDLCLINRRNLRIQS